MVNFLEAFARTLDAEAAAEEAGVDLAKAEAAFKRSRPQQKRLKQMFERRVSFYDHIPVAVIRTELVSILANRELGPGHRINAAKLLTELMQGGTESPHEVLGDLIKAIGRST